MSFFAPEDVNREKQTEEVMSPLRPLSKPEGHPMFHLPQVNPYAAAHPQFRRYRDNSSYHVPCGSRLHTDPFRLMKVVPVPTSESGDLSLAAL